MLEAIVAKVDDLNDGEMREVKVGETPVLLVKQQGAFRALGAHCTHYGAPLAKGVISGERVICPWHHACFRASDGALLEPPALDALPQYRVRVDGETVLVSLAPDAPEQREPAMAAPGGDARTVVIVGGGAAGQAAAEQLRESGFTGSITMLTAAAEPPVDRPALSKEYLEGSSDADGLPLRPASFYKKHGIEVRTNTTVTAIDLDSRTLTLAEGEPVQADMILLAPGSTPVSLDLPGADLPEVMPLRQPADADRILAAAGTEGRAVVIGASFIGMEVAASLHKRGLQVTVVAQEQVPYEKVVGKDVGAMFLNLHAEKGIEFRLGRKLARIEGQGALTGVVLDDGEQLPADLVVLGLGVCPATAKIDGLPLEKDGSVAVDATLRLADGVYAAGDVATYPDPISGTTTRIEHWRLAQQHGRHAAAAMLGATEPFHSVPFFWTKQLGVSARYVGHAKQWDDIIFWGDPADRKFLAFYVAGGKVVAAAGVKYDPAMAAIEELLRQNRMPDPNTLSAGELDLVAMLAETSA